MLDEICDLWIRCFYFGISILTTYISNERLEIPKRETSYQQKEDQTNINVCIHKINIITNFLTHIERYIYKYVFIITNYMCKTNLIGVENSRLKLKTTLSVLYTYRTTDVRFLRKIQAYKFNVSYL